MLSSEDKKQKRDALFAEGIEYANKEMNDQAIEKFKQCILLDGQFVDAYCSLGVVYINDKMYKEAILVLEKAVTIDSRKAIAYYLLGKVYKRQKEYGQAIKNWENFLLLEPDTARAARIRKRLKILSERVK